jgi:hypothetical protein
MEQQEYEAMRRTLEGIAQKQLEQATDLSRLFVGMDSRITLAEQTLRDVRLTMTGIGSLAKSLAERQENLAERQHVHEDIMKSLAATLVKQDTINERLTATIERLDRTTERLSTSIERLEGILVGIRDILRRGNGRAEG